MFNLTQIKQNTYIIEANEMIPLYKIDDTRCILLDSGLIQEREELEETLNHYGLTPVAILCSHAHIDHAANNGYFQEKYGTMIAMTEPEAGMCNHILNLKSYRLVVSPAIAIEEMSEMVHQADVILPAHDCEIDLAGVHFQIIFTPGHSCGHICAVTPDDVCYLGDALMSDALMDAKLPYGLAIALVLESHQKIRQLDCEMFVMAHRGTCSQEALGALVDANGDLLRRCADQIRDVVTEDIDFSELCRRACSVLGLHSNKPRRVLYYERNIRLFVEFLTDIGELTMIPQQGAVMFRRSLD